MNDLQLLGLRVRDKVTGLTGICESVCYDLYGCIQAVVRPVVSDKGEMQEGRWFDVSRLEVLDSTRVMDVPGGRFKVSPPSTLPEPSRAAGPTEKPAR